MNAKICFSVCAVALFFLGTPTICFSATQGFSGTQFVESVAVSDKKVVFVISGPCELLLGRQQDALSNAQVITTVTNHTALVYYREGQTYPTEESWQKACEIFKTFSAKEAYIQTTDNIFTWDGADLAFISTRYFHAWFPKK